jgi:tetratricopeptide (TPR) repeat protein
MVLAARLSVVLWLICAATLHASDGVEPYLQGLDLLEAGQFNDAVAAFEKAIEADDESADYRIALGVGLTLAEKLPEAEKALQRALKLSDNDKEARLWMATAVAMQGDFQRGTQYHPFAIAKDEYVNSIRRMSHEWGQAEFALATARRNGNNKWDVEYANQQLANRVNLRKQFPGFGAAFSQKMKARLPAAQQRAERAAEQGAAALLSEALMARIKANVDRSDYEAAMRDINPLLSGSPSDPQLIVYHGLCKLELGAPAVARTQFTRALYTWPLDGELYALRAVAAAQTGDQRRAGLDVATARSLGAKRVAWAERLIAAAPVADGDPPAMLQQLFEAARAGEAYASLVEKAGQLILVQNGRRLRLDEDFSDRHRQLQQAVDGDPQSASASAAYAAIWYENAVGLRGEAVELRAAWKPYRHASDQMIAAELDRALALSEQALKADASNVSAMITKAAVLVHRMRMEEADQFLQKALALAPEEPRLLKLFAEVADRAAAAKQAQAWSLRSPDTWEDQLYIYTRYPSQAELAQADALEAQAKRLWAMARSALEKAIANAAGTAEGAYFQAVLDRRDGRLDSALAAARHAAKLAPDHLEYHDMVVALLGAMGQKVDALLAQAQATNLVHSTAGPALKCVWFSLPRTRYKTSREYLQQASVYDAADPRVAAYYGAVAGADEKTDIAAAWYATAAALYEASARLEGVSAASREPSPLHAEVAAPIMSVNLRAIGLLRSGARPADAQALAVANLEMEKRIGQAEWWAPVPAAMLPDLDASQVPAPQADHVGYMLAVSRLELGRALIELKRYDNAIAQLQRARRYREMVPPTVDAGSKMQYPVVASNIYLVSALLAKGDTAAAREHYRYNVGRPRGLPADVQAEYERIAGVIEQEHRQAWDQTEQDAQRQQQDAMRTAEEQRRRQTEEINRRRRGDR